VADASRGLRQFWTAPTTAGPGRVVRVVVRRTEV